MFEINEIKNQDEDLTCVSGGALFWGSKRLLDIIISLILLPAMILLTMIIYFLNILFNKGPLFFIQKRMGKNCKPFNAIKFRTMTVSDTINRQYTDPLELDRITRFGNILRRLRLDELPQILNVIIGEMSLIGPRPDYYDHALEFMENIPDYKMRHIIKPGISGLSQIRLGYAEGLLETKKKSKIDIYYIKNVNFILDVKIFFATIVLILKSFRNK